MSWVFRKKYASCIKEEIIDTYIPKNYQNFLGLIVLKYKKVTQKSMYNKF